MLGFYYSTTSLLLAQLEPMQELSIDLLRQTAEALRQELGKRRAEIAALSEGIQRNEQELRLITELLRIRGSLEGQPETGRRVQTSGSASGAIPQRDGARLTEVVIEILRASGKPVHIQELVAKVRERKMRIPGKGEPANLITHIRTHSDIVRPVRGMYGLREWGIVDYSANKSRHNTKTRRTRRVQRTASSRHVEHPGTRSSRQG